LNPTHQVIASIASIKQNYPTTPTQVGKSNRVGVRLVAAARLTKVTQ
jgi:hypothetical protein